MTDERIRILVVDDDPELLNTLREYLENFGTATSYTPIAEQM